MILDTLENKSAKAIYKLNLTSNREVRIMFKKVLFVSLVLAGMLFCQMAAECFAGVWDQVEELNEFKQATAFKKSRNYQQAEKTYQDIIQQYPGTFWALEAQKKLTQLYILQGKDSQAEQTLNKMLKDFSSHSDMPKSLYTIAKGYRKVRKNDKADDLRQQIIQRYPDSVWTLWVQKEDAVVSHIAAGEDSAVETIVNKMTADFSGDSELPGVLYLIAKEYKKAGKDDKAEGIYQQLIQRYPGTIWVLRAQKERARVYLKSGNEKAVLAIVDELIADFSGHPGLAESLCKIARECEATKRFSVSEGIYQQVIQRFPGSSYARKAQLDMPKCRILSYIDGGNDAAARTAIGSLTANFDGHPDLPTTLRKIVERCELEVSRLEDKSPAEQAGDHFQKVVAIWEAAIDELPELGATPEACCWAGDCYSKMGKYAKAADYYQTVVDNWPDYQYAWNAQFLVGYYYQRLGDSGAVDKPIADAKIKAAYEQVLEKYPDCPAAGAARSWLSRHNSK